MKKLWKLLFVLPFMTLIGSLFSFSFVSAAPDFKTDFWGAMEKGDNHVVQMPVNPEASLKDNIQCLIYPNKYTAEKCLTQGGYLWSFLKYAGFVLLFIYILYVGMNLLMDGSKTDAWKEISKHFLNILIGAFLYFGAIWLLGTVLNINGGSEALVDSITEGKSSLGFQILSFAKTLAFFVAIVAMVVTGIKVIHAGSADKSKKLLNGVFYIVIALVIVKFVDFLFYLATQQNFAQEAANFIVSTARVLGYLYGAITVLMTFYAGYLYVTDGGKGEGAKKAQGLIVNILLSGLVLFGFLLILYQIFAEFVS